MAKRPKPEIGVTAAKAESKIRVNLTKEIDLVRPGVDIEITPNESRDSFRNALKVLANNDEYRDAAIKNPNMIIEDFDLSAKELQALRGIAKLSGADITGVDMAVAAELLANPGSRVSDTDVDVSCCSCCCCCCGETSVAIA